MQLTTITERGSSIGPSMHPSTRLPERYPSIQPYIHMQLGHISIKTTIFQTHAHDHSTLLGGKGPLKVCMHIFTQVRPTKSYEHNEVISFLTVDLAEIAKGWLQRKGGNEVFVSFFVSNHVERSLLFVVFCSWPGKSSMPPHV